MKLIVGLGNPGIQYQANRHNIGFIILDYFAESLNLKFKAGKGEYYISKGKFAGEEFVLLKPITFMNNSGLAVKNFIDDLNDFNLNDLLIVYDDFQIPLGTIRIKTKGSDGGHNGISSIIYHLITMDFPRMRIGIGKNEVLKKDDFVDYVLSDFSEEEISKIKELLPIYTDCIKSFLKTDLKNVMNSFNKNFLTINDSDENTENEVEPK